MTSKIIIITSISIVGLILLHYLIAVIGTSIAPNFTLTDIDGNDFTLSNERGKVVVIDWFATWCEPCKDQLEYLKEIKTKYVTDNLTIISISIDPNSDSVSDLRDYRSENAITWRILRDTGDIKSEYGAFFIPQIDIIDPNGQLSFSHIGVLNTAEMGKKINIALGLETDEEEEEKLELGMIATSFVLGVLVTFSPCLFPLLPSYLSFLLKTEENRIRGLWSGIFCTIGIMIVFVFVGILTSQAGSMLIENHSKLTLIMGGILILLGMFLISPLNIGILQKLNTGQMIDSLFQKERGTISLSLLIGLSFALIAAPCAMPIFLSVIIISLRESILQSMIRMIAFSIGTGLPFVIMGIMVPELKEQFIQKGVQFKRWSELISGLLILLVGLDMVLPHFISSYSSILFLTAFNSRYKSINP
ncbi:MAG: cytochrome c biogenesis protein CcdA [Promethearchaeota archaeon]